MSSRVAGAGLALTAVALLAVSIATPIVLPAQLSLFAGHPTVAGHVRETQEVYVGYYAAQLCNSGGDGTCKSGEATTAFRLIGYAELGATGLLAGLSVGLALLALRRSERRKLFASLLWAAGALALAGAGALVLVGPFHGASAPPGLGIALHGAGILAAMIAGVLARRRSPPIRLRVADRGSQPITALPTAQAFAMRQAPSGASPASRPYPMARDPFADPPARPTAADSEPGSDPFAPTYHTAERLPFGGSSQLRPLYEAAPIQGGTGGLLPIERPAMPMQPPAPVPRAAILGAPGTPLNLPFGAGEHRPMAPPPADSSAVMSQQPPAMQASMPPPRPLAADEPTALGPQGVSPLDADDEPVAMNAPFAAEELAPMPPPPVPALRAKPPSIPPPLPPHVMAAAAPPPPRSSSKPRTQISLVPPMPDNDLPIAPPTAQIVTDARPERQDAPSHIEPTLFPNIETPLAPPPAPAAPAPADALPRPRRESQLPRPLRSTQPPPSRPALKAAVPMPIRAARSAPSPTRPPPSAPPVPKIPPSRPTIATTVPPIPVIPSIPPLPAPRRAETDVTDPDGRPDTSTDADSATVSRVPIEVGDYVSQTNVSVGVPSPEEIDASVAGAGAGEAGPDHAALAMGDGRGTYVLDTSPSGEPLAVDRAAAAPAPAAAAPASAAAIASRPTLIAPAQQPPIVPVSAPPISPVVRDRPVPKLPISTAPDSLPPPRDNKQAIGPSPACPQCESPMAWVEEHLRFYCKSCRMYF